MNLYALISFVSAVLSIFLGFFVLARDPKSRINTAFMLFSVSVAYWSITELGYREAGTSDVAGFWLKLSALCPLVVALFLNFAIEFTGRATRRARLWMQRLAYGPALLFALVDLPTGWVTGQPLHQYWGWTYTVPNGIWYHLYSLWSTGTLLLLVALCFRYYLRTTDAQRRRQAGYVAMGFLLPVLLCVLTEVILPYTGVRVPELTTLGFAGANVLIGYAMWRHELFTISPVTAAERIIATMSDALFLVDRDGRIQEANRAAADLLQTSAEQLRGAPLAALFDDPTQTAICIGQPAGAGPDVETQRDVEVTLRTRHGRDVPVSLSTTLMRDSRGNPQGMVVIGRDVTERRHAHEALQRARDELETRVKERTAELAEEKERLAVTLRSIGDGVITTDTAGRVVLLNKMAETLTGWTVELAQGQPIAQVFHVVDEASREPLADPVQRVLAAGAITELPERTLLFARDGTQRRIADSGSPIRDASGAIVGVVLVFRDVTERRRLEEELLKAKKLESVGVLAGGIAHDFNNILTAITTNLFVAKLAVPADQDARRLIDEAEQAAFRATRLTRRLLTFARGGEPVREVASVKALIEESIGFHLSGSSVDYELDLDPDLLPVAMDRGQMDQVFGNLVTNAAQAMPGGGTITVRGRNVAVGVSGMQPERLEAAAARLTPGIYVKIAVRDEGMGIAGELMERIFDPYFTTRSDGVGLGLTIAYSVVDKHDGCITVESAEGKGATFAVYLPAAERTATTATAHTPVEAADAEETDEGPTRVLVMDDEEPVRRAAAALLEKLGYEVACAASGEEALESYRAASEAGRPFAVVILDLTVPGRMGGKECARHLGRLDPSVRAIVSSGYSTDPVMANHEAFGFVGVLPKPYRVEELTAALHRAMQHGS